MQVIQALLFIAGGIVVAVYVVFPAIQWLHDLIMGKAYREAKRERERQAQERGARWEAAERARVADKLAQRARDLERAYESDSRQRASLREKLNRPSKQ